VARNGHFEVNLYYRRRAKARPEAALAARVAMLDRLQWQVAELQESLDKAAAFNAVMGQVLCEPPPLIW
jgi:hypothetical protein